MVLFGVRTPPKLRSRTTLVVLGMHRSGTSAVTGMLADHGVELGPVSKRNRFNPRGNREIRPLNDLHDRVLQRSGGSWADPPTRIRVRRRDLRQRNEILAGIPGEVVGIKDPRMLLLLEMWRDLEPQPIGVIRNPVAVRESLQRRARERPRGHPQLSPAQWEELWVAYNRALLAEHLRGPFPLIDFDRDDNLDAQVREALLFWGLAPKAESAFFEPELIGDRAEDWRSRVELTEAAELFDELSARLGAGSPTPLR